ncbi:MAG: tetratricopeptide repeat protein, partial [Flavobacteriaceae bacterium]
YTRLLAHNLISQHRFKEAKDLLEESHAGPSHKYETELMLFDVYMELGEYERAKQVLENVESNTDYNYLIRLSKWNDHKGNLDEAIKYMVQAKRIAESRDSKALKIWTYSNLGDYYGHAGRIEDSYQHYLKTLQLQPDNAYAKKGIAWIIYSYEGNTAEAKRILDAVMENHSVPDYYLLKAEMAEYEGDLEKAAANEERFIRAVEASEYGAMYNAYLVEFYTDKDPERALQIAQKEVQNRATPETYHLLALAQLKNGAKEQALETIEKYVEGKTFEPMAQYHSALVYQANGLEKKVKPLKSELLEASFELGPVLTEKIKML